MCVPLSNDWQYDEVSGRDWVPDLSRDRQLVGVIHVDSFEDSVGRVYGYVRRVFYEPFVCFVFCVCYLLSILLI